MGQEARGVSAPLGVRGVGSDLIPSYSEEGLPFGYIESRYYRCMRVFVANVLGKNPPTSSTSAAI
jgi:hypothetical protein